MEKYLTDWEQNNLINELTQGMELAKQLQTSSSLETREFLVHKILNSYDKALSMLKWNGSVLGDHLQQQPQPSSAGAAIGGMSDSPRSLSESPPSEEYSDREFKDVEASKKRKAMPRWTKQVQVCPGTGLEGPLEDGYSWRKYGQKDILGAKYPRGYYRCTHRHAQGCLATKQVQRSDEDPTIFEITYRGRHTCTPHSTPAPSAAPEIQEPNVPNQQQTQNQPQQNLNQSQEMLLSFQTGLRVRTEDLVDPWNQTFYFPKPENYIHPSTSTMDNNLISNFSPSTFVSPATSGSSYFSVSPAANIGSFGGNYPNLQTENVVSAATSTNNSPTVGLDFPFGGVDQFEPTFSFDHPEFF